MNRYGSTWEISREEKAQRETRQLGYDYMHGTVSIADIQTFLYSCKVIEVGGYTEAVKLVKKGADWAIEEGGMYILQSRGETSDENVYTVVPVAASRVQPEQDAQEVAAIAARPRVRQKRYYWDKPYPKPFIASKDVPETSWELDRAEYTWLRCLITINAV